ncbi:MAG: hypothetical protein R6V85_16725 [Polyangia bacterium]
MSMPIPVEELSEQVRKICAPGAPPKLKQMAAAGVAPLGPADLVSALAVLARDEDRSVADKARGSVVEVPANVRHGALEGDLHPAVLDALSDLLIEDEAALERILLNGSTPDETVARLADQLRSEKLLEIVAANEQRMLRHPAIIEAMYMNTAARMSTVDRAVELAVRNGIELDIPSFEETRAALEGELIVEANEEPTPDDLLFNQALDMEELEDLSHELVEETLEKHAAGEEDEEEQESRKVNNLLTNLSRLSVSQKVRMATLGSSQQRSVLIRDSNKMVIMAVLKSPGIGENEVVRYTKARSLPDEAVRYITSKRDWTKQYQVKLNLVQNPRTPLQEALKFLNHLRAADVRSLERNRDVPQAISRAAKQLREKRSH